MAVAIWALNTEIVYKPSIRTKKDDAGRSRLFQVSKIGVVIQTRRFSVMNGIPRRRRPSSAHMDLPSILPEFPTKPYSHILPPLERKQITVVDLITLDTLEIAKRARVPPADVRRLCAQIIEALHRDLGFQKEQPEIESSEDADPRSKSHDEASLKPGPSTKLDLSRWSTISTLDPALDALLDGGIPTGYVTEITGERSVEGPTGYIFMHCCLPRSIFHSGSGKTQFLLSLLLAAQLPQPRGLGKRTIYISTEAPLATGRLCEILKTHPYLSTLPPESAPSLENILSINAIDLETQDHILSYQLPVAVSRYNVGLVVIDSIAANFRAEHTSNDILGISTRSGELAKLGQFLRNLAVKENIAIVVANQVSDRFDTLDGHPRLRTGQVSNSMREFGGGAASPLPRSKVEGGGGGGGGGNNLDPHSSIPSSSPAIPSSQYAEEENTDGSYLVGNPARNEILSLVHQQRFFTGWGDVPLFVSDQDLSYYPAPSHKTPALGLVWSTQIACRIAFKKEDEEPPPLDHFETLSQAASSMNSGTQARSSDEDDANADEDAEASTKRGSRGSLTDPVSRTELEGNGAKSAVKSAGQRTPASSQVAAERTARRRMKLVFAPWTAGATTSTSDGKQTSDEGTATSEVSDEVEFEIWKGGIRSVVG